MTPIRVVRKPTPRPSPRPRITDKRIIGVKHEGNELRLYGIELCALAVVGNSCASRAVFGQPGPEAACVRLCSDGARPLILNMGHDDDWGTHLKHRARRSDELREVCPPIVIDRARDPCLGSGGTPLVKNRGQSSHDGQGLPRFSAKGVPLLFKWGYPFRETHPASRPYVSRRWRATSWAKRPLRSMSSS